MTLAERYKSLTPEQKEKFSTVKNEKDFDAFLNEYNFVLPDELKAKVLEYINTDKLPLSEEELESVAGGGTRKHYEIYTDLY